MSQKFLRGPLYTLASGVLERLRRASPDPCCYDLRQRQKRPPGTKKIRQGLWFGPCRIFLVSGALNPHGRGSARESYRPRVVGGDMAASCAAVRGAPASLTWWSPLVQAILRCCSEAIRN